MLPTRVHERYLLPAFAAGVILAAPRVWRLLVYPFGGLLRFNNRAATHRADGAPATMQ